MPRPTAAIGKPSRLRFVLQRMYLNSDTKTYHVEYFALAQALVSEDPTLLGWISETNHLLITGELYQVVKLTKHHCPMTPSSCEPTSCRMLCD